ncbi:hypothetical protein TUM19329_13600 [Legionella antarctica]|uniref:Uncharacterized protein n=1 Tax=Legionella antarctica TaxID=2708020 RepID=A0A6F8T3I1_9GAMM|nr:hypothetical protein [Legionella antarctica]BCA94999.1 hypothetical protein TUM19329_13600 [Legionella antarctica]
MKQIDNSPTHSGSDVPLSDDTPQAIIFKQVILNKLSTMRQNIQRLLYDKAYPERAEYVQRANFIYALMFKIKEGYTSNDNLLAFINSIEKEYPLAGKTISDVKNMPEMQKE